MYLYPDNLTARAMLWLWTLRDVAVIGVGALLSALALTQIGLVLPLVITAVYAFLAIRHDGISMLDFLRCAAAFFFGQQYFEWSNKHEAISQKPTIKSGASCHRRDHRPQHPHTGRRAGVLHPPAA